MPTRSEKYTPARQSNYDGPADSTPLLDHSPQPPRDEHDPHRPQHAKHAQVGPDPPPAQAALHLALFPLEQLVALAFRAGFASAGVGVGVGGEEDEARFAQVKED